MLIVLTLVGRIAVSPLLSALVTICSRFWIGGRYYARRMKWLGLEPPADRRDGSPQPPAAFALTIQPSADPPLQGDVSRPQPTRTQGGPAMGQKTDKIIGRAKQALGAITGSEKMKREGQRREDKGKLKGKLDSTIGKTQDALKDLKNKADRS
jgi:uncharacterized protein YjbJ (UPF0337 family)